MKTSRAAPAIKPCSSASTSACSSTTPPREQLTILALRFICRNCGMPIIPLVWGVNGTWKVKKSALRSTSSRVTDSMPNR